MNRVIIFSLQMAALAIGACHSQKTSGIEGRTKRETLSVVSKVPGRILRIYVLEGDRVRKGDTLALLDMPEVIHKLEQAEGALVSANAQYQMSLNGATSNQLLQLEAKNFGLKEQFEFAEVSFDRVKNMYQDSLLSKQKYDEAYARLAGARAQLEAAQAELAEARQGVRIESKQMALGQKERAKGVVNEVNSALAERYILAPEDMSVETITLHVGELALPGYSLFNGYSTQSTYFRFTVPESAVAKFKVNAGAAIELPFFHKTLAGKIASIKQLNRYADVSSAFPNYEMGESIYELKVTPVNPADAADLLANTTAFLK